MATKITLDTIKSYLICKYKGHLKLAGECGTKSDYEAMTAAADQASREEAVAKLAARFGEGNTSRGTAVTTAALKQRTTLLVDASFDDDAMSLRFDGLKRVDGASGLGDHHYMPVLHNHVDKVGRHQKLLLAVLGLTLAGVQGLRPALGLVASGPDARLGKVRLDAKLYRQAEQVVAEVKRHQACGELPRLTLNKHCQLCEFRERCRKQAEQADDLSLLRGMSEQEISSQNSKGIFTVRQLSYTFRVRRKNKRAKRQSFTRSFALQALAIRENKIHVHGSYAVPTSPTSIYLDIEGLPDRNSYYLIGLVVVENGGESRHSFWADCEEEQTGIFARLLEKLGSYPDYRLFHFGNYETKALRRIKRCLPEDQQQQVEVVLGRAVNVLSIINAHVYFPTYSCGLKEIARSIGCDWSEPDASGLQSVRWRTAWEKSRDESHKAKLVRYNLEDCIALKAVVDLLACIAPKGTAGGVSSLTSPEVVRTEDLQKAPVRRHQFGKKDSSLPGFNYVNQCAYFDHQRDKVFARTNSQIKAIKNRRKARLHVRINKVVELTCKRCSACNSKKLRQIGSITQQIIDLKFFRDGVKRWVTKYQSWNYHCEKCDNIFIHAEFPQVTTKYGRGLISWCIYQNVACGQNMLRVRKVLAEVFKLRIVQPQMYRFKTAVAEHYQASYTRILHKLLRGPLIHIDETEVDLRGRKGYVWVLTSMDQVYYFYRDSREGTFLKEMLRGFQGVLVSDFYTAYDSLECQQQKCLIHLLRDLNEDLLKNPFDEAFKALAQKFSTLLQKVVETIDRYGLKKMHLHKNREDVKTFFEETCAGESPSVVARGYQSRFVKYRGKLFTFLDHDSVPWNNNNAEHAIKCFARYRQFADGRFTEASINDYLVILSVYQTCEYQGINFLGFLRGKEQDEAGSFGSGRRKTLIMDEVQPSEQHAPDPGPPVGSHPAILTGDEVTPKQ
jgi:predicted RecB family nuclease